MLNSFKAVTLLLLISLLFSQAHAELVEIARNKSYSVLKKRNFEELDPFSSDSKSGEQHFFLEGMFTPASVEIENVRSQIDATLEKVTSSNKFVKFLDEKALVELPVGIKKTVGSLEYIILIDSVEASAEYTTLYASMSFETPKTGKIHFKGESRFSRKGGVVDGVLMLVGDYPNQAKLNANKDKTQFVIRGSNGGTFVEFDCDGFKQFGIEGSFVFSNETIQPEDANGNILEDKNVSIDFSTTVTDWNDILLEVDIDPFQIKGLKDVSFAVTRAVIDLSDTRNQAGVAFPQEYVHQSPYHQSGTPELWRGIFIGNLTISLPHQFDTATTTNGKDGRIRLIGQNMLIDDLGFTGVISGQNLIPLDKGKMGKWKFALDEISVKIVVNELTEGSIRGQIDIPIRKGSEEKGTVDKNQLFAYSAMVKKGGEYLFNVSSPEKLEFSLWGAADVTLLPSSYIEVTIDDNKFRPVANLNGTMNLNVGLNSENGEANSDEKKNVSLGGVTFQDLKIQSVKPYVSVGAFSLGLSSSGMGGFPIQINEISGGQSGEDIFLGVDLTLQLTGDDGNGFGAEGAFKIFAKSVETGSSVKYQFKSIEIEKLGIDIVTAAFSFKGKLLFFKNDPVYGNGINGSVEAKFSEFGMSANAVFGSVDGMRYWYVDAMVDLGTGIPVFTGFFMTRFGGGAYYHMALDNKGIGSELGTTNSGITYVPDKGTGLGIKAIVGVAGGNEKGFFAEVTFEMAFRSSGGLRYIKFVGNVSMLTIPVDIPPELLKAQAKLMAAQGGGKEDISNPETAEAVLGSDRGNAAIFGSLTIEMNFDDKSLHANLSLDINVAGGVIYGGGNAVMHFAPSEWYIYIGRPEKENRINLNIMSVLRVDAYFVMGSVVPDSPPPPEKVSEILGGVNLDYMSDLNSLADGAGIGFGASLSIDTGDITFLIFYGRFEAGVGFDIMLKDYGNAICSGRGQLGIDGWYANGQAYAYFDGTIGIRVKIFGKTKKVEILSIAAAVVLQAKLPNPVWMKGIVGGRFRALGGLVKGECKFELEIGEECDLQYGSSSDVLKGLDVIGELTPGEGASDVDVFSLPQAVFNYEMNKSYEIVEGERKIQFRITAQKMELRYAQGLIPTTTKWSSDKMTAALRSEEILPPQSDLKFGVVVAFEEYENGLWKVVKSDDGSELTETKTVSFKTGEAPNYIPESNIAYAYPLLDMVNYYPEEYPNGFLQLEVGQTYLFEDQDYESKARFAFGTESRETLVAYNSSKKEVSFSIPTSLQKDRVYTLELIKAPKKVTNIESNVSETVSAVNIGNGMTAETRSRTAEGTVKGYEEEQLFVSHFRVSKFSTFSQKAAMTFGSGGFRYPIYYRVFRLGTNLVGTEEFSHRELKDVGGINSLISLEADMSNSWYRNSALPIMYENYPMVGNIRVSFTHRDGGVQVLGTPPTRAVYIWQVPYDVTLPEDAKTSGFMATKAPGGRFIYLVSPEMYNDYVSTRNQLAGAYVNSSSLSSRAKSFLAGSFPDMKNGDYWINCNYVIPGRNVVSSTYRHKIKYTYE